jgi:hypothetical protein
MMDKFTAGDATPGREGTGVVPDAQSADLPSAHPIHGGRDTEAGLDRRLGCPNIPHVGESWRHLRTGVVGEIVWRYEDAVLTSATHCVWPIDLFCAKWVKA